MKLFANIKKESGIALLLALMLVSLTLVIAIFAASIGAGQLRFTGSSADSARAFAAADSGIEFAMSRINLGLAVGQDLASCKCGAGWCAASTGFTSNEEYCVTADNPSSPRKITAVGRTTDTKIRRSLEIVLPAYAAVNVVSTVCFNGDGVARTLDQICQLASVQGGPYVGASGLVGSSPITCAVANSYQAMVIGIHRSGTPVFTQTAGTAYMVQCYK